MVGEVSSSSSSMVEREGFEAIDEEAFDDVGARDSDDEEGAWEKAIECLVRTFFLVT